MALRQVIQEFSDLQGSEWSREIMTYNTAIRDDFIIALPSKLCVISNLFFKCRQLRKIHHHALVRDTIG
jgi:hypothetical protein